MVPDRSEVVKDFTPECGGKTPRGAAPRGFTDTRGGKTFATEQEGGVMSFTVAFMAQSAHTCEACQDKLPRSGHP